MCTLCRSYEPETLRGSAAYLLLSRARFSDGPRDDAPVLQHLALVVPRLGFLRDAMDGYRLHAVAVGGTEEDILGVQLAVDGIVGVAKRHRVDDLRKEPHRKVRQMRRLD